ncbi:hypothetical protein VT84_12150 [Gemmata sp. SH-PL17]|uniref:hypothetical protein n=1 Tax=Gemmata sp. SH-PL17 TaxID=1630693 RepID=UPI00078DA631|nr:hypothetical protein [Gemmata sp. SH-PL17]AMV25141.1 hypothetical protein VT84_12150 [Gemmata sp. SH-PL17]
MTEAEWLACEDAQQMLDFIRVKASERELRLWACASALQRHGRFGIAEAVAIAEEWADDVRPVVPNHPSLAWVCNESAWRAAYEGTAGDLKRLLRGSTLEVADNRRALRYQLLTLHDIFGNPFRPITFLPEWHSSTAVALASQMYESRDFGAMPILADALQDAGCDSADVFDHCRGPGPHVRGCWVVDLVLGKE